MAKPQPADNKIFLDEHGIVHHLLHGDQTAESVTAIRESNAKMVAKLREEGKRVAIFIDLSAVKNTSSATRNEAKKILETDYDAMAILGNRYLRPIISYVMRITGISSKVRYFGNKVAALSWLQDPKAVTREPNKVVENLRHISISGWVILLVLILVGFSAYNSWQQAQERLDSQAQTNYDQELAGLHGSLTDLTNIYLDVLIGFRGLFYSSETVEESEFNTYFKSLEILKRYPGIETINYVQRSVDKQGEDHYVVTYVAVPSKTAPKGTDRLLEPIRAEAFKAARDSGLPTASRTIELVEKDSNGNPAVGFTIIVPIYGHSDPSNTADRRAKLTGFITGVFNYENFFKVVFNKASSQNSMRVFDGSNLVYTQGDQTATGTSLTSSQPFLIAGHGLVLDSRVPVDFGLTATELRQIRTTIASAIIVALLLVMLFWQQVRARSRTLKLADAMTEDLQNERNEAIATRNKDEAILSSIADGVFVLDPQGKIILFNKTAEQLSGYSASEVLGKHYDEVLKFSGHNDPSPHDDFIVSALKGKQAEMSRGTVLTRKDGQMLSVADSAAPVYDVDDKQRGVIVVFRDVTQQEQLDQAKDEFISIVSHQLRTPLTAMRLFSEMLIKKQVGPLNDKQYDYIQRIQLSTARMIRLVGDILNVSRIELGRVRVVPEPTDVNDLIKSHIDEIIPLADVRKIKIVFKPEPKLPTVNLDPAIFGQVLHNLLTNAIRYTPEGRGAVEVSFTEQSKGYVLSVKDNGIGIPPEDQPHIFERFYRAENAIAVEGEGTGLGLYLVKLVVDAIGGSAYFESHDGKGTTFYITLPPSGMKAKKGEKTLN
jgi:PAS domain S-box-containing protein